MKLLFCQACKDILLIRPETRSCYCGKSGGKLVDQRIQAEIWGEATPIGIHNHSFAQAMIGRPISGLGTEFTAFVIPKMSDTVSYSPLQKKAPNMNKIIFLDFDGVLHPPPIFLPSKWEDIIKDPSFFYPHLVDRVISIAKNSGSKIVVTSSWRIDFNLDQFNQILDGLVIGVTPLLDLPISDYKTGGVRYKEVQDYLTYECNRSAKWLAIDDQRPHYPELPNIVITDPQAGLTEEQAKHCLSLLS